MRSIWMIKGKWLFIGTDKRMSLCSKIMSERGYTCRAVKMDTYTEELKQVLIDFSPDNIVFPIHQIKGTIPLELINEGTQLYTGAASDAWITPFEQAEILVHRYLHEEQFIWENARLTAEALVSVYYTRTGRTISGKSFYVAGYGRVGKMVADVLASLGGQVSVIARSDGQLAEAAARGFKIGELKNMFEVDSCLINTIPSQWLSIKSDTNLLIFDLASLPGCLTGATMPEYYTLLPGLPGKYFPLDAATALAGALERIYRR